jgi:hypothetical protein
MASKNIAADQGEPRASGPGRWLRLAAYGLTGLALVMLIVLTLIVLIAPYDAATWVVTQSRLLGAAPIFVGCAVSVAVSVWAAMQHSSKTRRAPVERVWKSRARSAFVFAVSVWMALYVLAVVNISWLFDIEAWPVWARVMAAIAPALPIGGVIVALLRYLKREADEYQRSLLTRAVLIATGLTFFVVTAWGFLELYVGAPHFPPSLVMCPFWLFFGVSNWWVRRA